MERTTAGWGSGLLGIIIFSGSLPATRVAVADFSPMFLTSVRAVVAALLGAAFLLALRQALAAQDRSTMAVLAAQVEQADAALALVTDKLSRVANFHASTMHSLIELTAAAGLDHPNEFGPQHFSRRVSGSEVLTFAQLYPQLAPGELLDGTRDARFRAAWDMASAADFRPSMARAA